jgi:hypothetical protein
MLKKNIANIVILKSKSKLGGLKDHISVMVPNSLTLLGTHSLTFVGICIDLFDEIHECMELKKLYFESKTLKTKYLKLKKELKEIEDKIIQRKKKQTIF